MTTMGKPFGWSLSTASVSLLLLFILSLFIEPTVTAVDCSKILRCDDCLKADPSCMWCDDQRVLLTISRNQSNTQGARLCGDSARMMALGCEKVVDPPSSVQSQMSSAGASVSISTATVKLRPGKPGRLNVSVTPPQSAAVDMYLVIDITQTMLGYLDALKTISSGLVARMSNITTEFRIGFGTFVDKNVVPFSDPLLPNQCVIGGGSCLPSHDFRHVVTLTSNSTEFDIAINNVRSSGGLDPPEAVLDALLQSAVCEDIIGWRPRRESQRIIIALTDADYHYGLDARIAGIAKLPTTKCEIDPTTGEYSTAGTVEYPSAAFIGQVLSDNLITPIFGASAAPRELYIQLSKIIGSATVARLEPNSATLLDQIVNEFQSVSGTVIPTIRVPDAVKDILTVSILPVDDCRPGSVGENSITTCTNITYPNAVTYEVTIEGTQALCDLVDPVTIEIQFIRFGSVNLTVTPICACDCSSQRVENSDVCSNSGTLVCSTCICNAQRQGATCQCPDVRGVADTGCIAPGADQVCSGRGSCSCGRCKCDTNTQGEPYDGEYCQFDPTNCPSGRDADGVLRACSGNGECNNFLCQCGSGYGGRACDCTNDNSTCVDPSGDPSTLCSGEGQCVCGQCVCNDYSISIGQYCQECLPCRTSCSQVSPCVLCLLVDGMECPANLTCESRIKINDSVTTTTQDMKVCSIREGSCEVRYFLNRRIRGDESDITVFMDGTQSSIEVLRKGSTQCQRGTLIWPIFVGIIGGTIILGILIVVLWRGCTYLGEYLEFKQWKKSIENDTERTGENPLFVGAIAEYQNPRYRRT